MSTEMLENLERFSQYRKYTPHILTISQPEGTVSVRSDPSFNRPGALSNFAYLRKSRKRLDGYSTSVILSIFCDFEMFLELEGYFIIIPRAIQISISLICISERVILNPSQYCILKASLPPLGWYPHKVYNCPYCT